MLITGDRSFFGHPRALATLFFTEMWERFTFYGMRALLVLFLVDAVQSGGLGLDDRTATAIYGLYTAATFMAALPGGWIADRLLGAQRAIVAGGVLMTLGNAMLVVPGPPALFFTGLAVIVAGVGLLKPNVSALVAQLYPEGGARRDAGFTLFYMGINSGAFIGPLVAGYLAENLGWRWGFLAATLAVPLGTLQFWLSRARFAGAGAAPHRSDAGAGLGRDWRILLAVAGGLLLALILAAAGVIPIDPAPLAKRAAWVLVAMAAGYFAYLFFFAGLAPVERRRVVVLLSMFVACALFWAGYEQAGSSLNLFARRFVDRTVGGFEIPAGWLQSVGPLFVIAFAPLFSMLWVALARRLLDPAVPVKFGLALILMGSGFLFMVHAANVVAAGMRAPVRWLVLTYMVHVFGELCLSPVGLSTVTKLAPMRFVGQMMGVWFLASSLGKLLAGLIAGTFDAGDVAAMPGQFLGIVVCGVIVGGVLLLLARPLTRLMGGVR